MVIIVGALLAVPALLPEIMGAASSAPTNTAGWAEADEVCTISGSQYVPNYRPANVTANYRPSNYSACQRSR